MNKYLNFMKKYIKVNFIKESQFITDVNNALNEINRARINFDMAVGQDNVELAILELNSAEKRYQNLIKEAKEKRINRLSEYDFSLYDNKVAE